MAETDDPRPATKNPTTAEREGDRALVVRRTFDAPRHSVFEAWTQPALFSRWWVPRSCGLTLSSCELDVRVGGTYRLVFALGGDASKPMAFHGRYLEVVPSERLVWTNEEDEDGGPVTTVTFEERSGKTHLVMRDLHPSKESLDRAVASGSTSTAHETFAQLDELLGA
jgi:uncharacterized protein YndB with AHSA1/START domain